MKKNIAEKLPANNEAINKDRLSPDKKLNEGGLNSKFPQEYEEQVSPNIRMKPQPFNKKKN
jgi:hypothetical protein